MKRFSFVFLLIASLTLTSCDVIGDIFEAGVWSGVILVIAIIALVVWLLSRMRK